MRLQVFADAILFDVNALTHVPKPALPWGTHRHAVVAPDPWTVFCCGGTKQTLPTVEDEPDLESHILIDGAARFDLRADQWTQLAPMPAPVFNHAFVEFDEHTLVSFGGRRGFAYSNCIDTAQCYDVRSDRWREEPRWKLPSKVSGLSVVKW